MRHSLEMRMDELFREIRAVRGQLSGLTQYLSHLEHIASDVANRIEQVEARELVIEDLLDWMGKDYKYRDMTGDERRQFELIGAHIQMLMKERGIQSKIYEDVLSRITPEDEEGLK